MIKLKYPIVNDSDKIIGSRERERAYKEKAMLRSVQIFVFNFKGELYIQKRGKYKTRYPNYFCASVAGHVEPGESYRQAAARELMEELGLHKAGNLKFITKEKIPVGKGDYAMSALFSVKTDETVTLQAKEIDGGNFYAINNIKQLILKKRPFTPGFLYFFKKHYKISGL